MTDKPKRQIGRCLHYKRDEPRGAGPTKTAAAFEQAKHQELKQRCGNVDKIDANQPHNFGTALAYQMRNDQLANRQRE